MAVKLTEEKSNEEVLNSDPELMKKVALEARKDIIIFDNVTKVYPGGVTALKNVDFRIYEGEFVFLMGSSGAGKSTLFKLLEKEDNPTSGRIIVNGRDLNKIHGGRVQTYRRGIGIVFQDFKLLYKKTVYQNVAFAMEITGQSRSKIDANVKIALQIVGLTNKANEFPAHLSGGEQQRVALARAIVNYPSILIADEPTGNLDPQNSKEVFDVLLKINAHKITVLVATHEQYVAAKSGKRIIKLDHGNNISTKEDT